ncbi:MAG: hypothetical protein OEY44_01845 [Candidatus Peregrinibacteria bacterium]|nr:hypothetical protein [Candidatus Peregrinibacteria bacterium]
MKSLRLSPIALAGILLLGVVLSLLAVRLNLFGMGSLSANLLGEAPSAPTNLVVNTLTETSASFGWDADASASEYRVYHNSTDSQPGSYTAVSSPAHSITYASGASNYIWITSVSSGAEGDAYSFCLRHPGAGGMMLPCE